MNIALIGMSGCGKSFWAKKISEELQLPLHGCDDLIEERLKTELSGSGTAGLSAWMGYPFEPRYKENSAIYLQHEKDVTEAALMRIQLGSGLVIDTTGSVIYLEIALLEELKKNCTIVLLDASDSDFQLLSDSYFANPKPVYWGDLYRPTPGEDGMNALRRCYPDLIRFRLGKYRKLAQVIVPSSLYRDPKSTAQDIIKYVTDEISKHKR